MFKVFLVKKNKRLYGGISVFERRFLEYDVLFLYCEGNSVELFILFVVLDIMYLLLLVNLDKVLVLILLSMLFILMFNGNVISSVFKFFKVEKEKENFLKKFKLNLLFVENWDKVVKGRESNGNIGCEVFNEKYIDYGGKTDRKSVV